MAHMFTSTPKKFNASEKDPSFSSTYKSPNHPLREGSRIVQSNVCPDLHLTVCDHRKQNENQSFRSDERAGVQLGQVNSPTRRLPVREDEAWHASPRIRPLRTDNPRYTSFLDRPNTGQSLRFLKLASDVGEKDHNEHMQSYTAPAYLPHKQDVCKSLQYHEVPVSHVEVYEEQGTNHKFESRGKLGMSQKKSSFQHDAPYSPLKSKSLLSERWPVLADDKSPGVHLSSNILTLDDLDSCTLKPWFSPKHRRHNTLHFINDIIGGGNVGTSVKRSCPALPKVDDTDQTESNPGGGWNTRRGQGSKYCGDLPDDQLESLSQSSCMSLMSDDSMANFSDEAKMAVLPSRFGRRQMLPSSLSGEFSLSTCNERGLGIIDDSSQPIQDGRRECSRLSQSLSCSNRYRAAQGEITCPDGRCSLPVAMVKSPMKPKNEKELRNTRKECREWAETCTHRTVRLIQLVYRMDPGTRHNIIIMARWFHQWRCNVQHMNRQRRELARDLNLAASQLRRILLQRYFSLWKYKLKQSSQLCRASTLHRAHLLRKGMKSFMWAVMQERRQADVARQHRTQLLQRVSFTKWVERYQRRKHEALQCWLVIRRKEADLQTRCKAVSTSREWRLLGKSFNCWRERTREKTQTQLACLHYKQVMMFRVVRLWRVHCAEVKVKQFHQSLASIAREDAVKRQMFTRWVGYLNQSQRSRNFHRKSMLCKHWKIWCKAQPVHKAIRQRLISVARHHWRGCVLHSYLHKWRVALKEKMAAHIAGEGRLRRAWNVWLLLKYKRCNERRLKNWAILRTAFNMWQSNTQILQQRCQRGTTVLELSLLRRLFAQWRDYTAMKTDLRAKMMIFENQTKVIKMRVTFVCWWHRLAECRDKKFATIYWSHLCTKNAAGTWRSVVRGRKIEKLEQEVKRRRNFILIKAGFAQWINEKQKADREETLVERLKRELKLRKKRRLFTEWRILTHQSQTVLPLVTRVRKRQLLCVLDGWRCVVLRTTVCRRYLKRRQKHTLTRYFLCWRVKFLLAVQIYQCVIFRSTALVCKCFLWWRGLLKGRLLADDFRHKSLLIRCFTVWKWQSKKQISQQQQAKAAEDLYWKKESFAVLRCYVALRKRKRELVALAEDAFNSSLKKHIFTDWLYRLQERRLLKPSCMMSHQQPLHRMLGQFTNLHTGQYVQRNLQMATLRQSWTWWRGQVEQASLVGKHHDSRLVKRFFMRWCSRLRERKDNRKKADELRAHFLMKRTLGKWKQRVCVCRKMYDLLSDFTRQKNLHVMAVVWKTWSRALELNKAEKQQNRKVLKNMFSRWKIATEVLVDQNMRWRAMYRAVNERTLKLVFSHWRRRLFTARLGYAYYHSRLIKMVFVNWIMLVKRNGCLKRLQNLYISTRETTTLWRMFMFWKDTLQRNRIAVELKQLWIIPRQLRLKRAAWETWKRQFLQYSAERHETQALLRRFFRKWHGQLMKKTGLSVSEVLLFDSPSLLFQPTLEN